MTAGRTTTRRDRIEQRLALGDIPEEVSIRLHVPLAEVLKVGEAMDAAARETDHARNDKCRKGLHPATPDNTYVDPRGGRTCRPCKNASSLNSAHRRKRGRAA